jgi:hypothetical protein
LRPNILKQKQEKSGNNSGVTVRAGHKVMRALHMAAAFCREDQLFCWVRQQSIQKGLAPSNAAVWRQHTAPALPGARRHAPAAASHATTQRTRNQWILRWSRRWNVRRGFFKAGERVPIETRQAKAEFRSCGKHV